MTRQRFQGGRRRGWGMLGWALGISAALHLLAALAAVAWPQPAVPPPPAAPGQEATVEVVMGNSAESNGSAAPPPAAPAAEAAPAAAEAAPAAAEAAAAAAQPATAAAAEPPSRAAWQGGLTLGDGMVGAAELQGPRLRPAVGTRGNIPPGYPHESARLGEQGVVLLRMVIAADGQVSAVEVLRSSGYPRLDNAAQAAIARWHFTPAVTDGAPVQSEQVLPVRFRLN